MPLFSTRPPDQSAGHGLPLIRTPANRHVQLALTCPDLVGCPTHWFGGHTVPCEADDCKPCNEGYPWRWHGYVSGLLAPSRRQVLMEFTAQACEHITTYRDNQGTLRGAILTAERHRNRYNGRVLVSLKPGDLESLNLPAAPDIIAMLSKIWNIAVTGISAPDQVKNMPALRVADPEKGNNRPAAIAAAPKS